MVSREERLSLAIQEKRDNFGVVVTKKINVVKSELRSVLKGAPKVVRNALATEYGAVMRPKDYELSAWFAGYTGDIGELLTIKETGYSVDMPSDRQGSTPFYVACALGQLEIVKIKSNAY